MIRFLGFMVLLVLSACSPELSSILSVKESLEASSNYRLSEPSSKIRFQVSNDKERLFLRFNTNEPTTILKILQTGLSIYFDEKGKKSKTCFVEYPLRKRNLKMSKAEIQGEEKKKISELYQKVSDDAKYQSPSGQSELFDIVLSKSAINIKMTLKDSTELNYQLSIPLELIQSNTTKQELAFGLESGAFNVPQKIEIRASGTRNANPYIVQPTREIDRTTTEVGNSKAQLTSPINFWYKILLNQSYE